MLMIDITASAIADGASDEYIGQEVVPSRVTGEADGRGDAVYAKLNKGAFMAILLGDNSG